MLCQSDNEEIRKMASETLLSLGELPILEQYLIFFFNRGACKTPELHKCETLNWNKTLTRDSSKLENTYYLKNNSFWKSWKWAKKRQIELCEPGRGRKEKEQKRSWQTKIIHNELEHQSALRRQDPQPAANHLPSSWRSPPITPVVPVSHSSAISTAKCSFNLNYLYMLIWTDPSQQAFHHTVPQAPCMDPYLSWRQQIPCSLTCNLSA